ncbi:MAG: hypothetical protein IPN67_16540 [Bacteroidales bacterium]|nr:hypothetical protein [Bacteroidales bacterium]
MKIKKLGFVLLIVSMMLPSLIAQGQSDSLVSDKVAYLYFYRSKQFMGSGNGIGIKINENETQRLKNGTRLIVEYSQLNQPIVITYYNKINFMTAFGKLEIEPKGGKIYYIKVNWGNDNEIGNQEQNC